MRRTQLLVLVIALLVAFATNAVLDLTLDPPMLLRWALALAASLLATLVLSKLLSRRARED